MVPLCHNDDSPAEALPIPDSGSPTHSFRTRRGFRIVDSDKALIRKHYCELRNRLDAPERAAASLAICGYIRQLPEYRRHTCVAAFSAFGAEPDLQFLFGEKRWFLPRFNRESALYDLVEVDDPKTQLVTGRYGIVEPRGDLPAAAASWCRDNLLFLVPAVACSADGTRLGRGGGYYDRLLSGAAQPKIGVIFSCQLAEKLPYDAHDVLMDVIVTENGMTRCGR